MRAIGLVAAPFTGPLAATARRRERPARWLAWWQVTVTHPRPRFLGPREAAPDDGAAQP